jgi:hypothetical protein
MGKGKKIRSKKKGKGEGEEKKEEKEKWEWGKGQGNRIRNGNGIGATRREIQVRGKKLALFSFLLGAFAFSSRSIFLHSPALFLMFCIRKRKSMKKGLRSPHLFKVNLSTFF